MMDADTIHDYLNGDLDEAKVRELTEWLLAAPEHRVQFRREVALAISLATSVETASASAVPKRTASSARHRVGTPQGATKETLQGESKAELKPALKAGPNAAPKESLKKRGSSSASSSRLPHHQRRTRQSRFMPGLLVVTALAAGVVIAVVLNTDHVVGPSPVPRAPATLDTTQMLIGDVRGAVSVVRDQVAMKTLPTSLRAGDQVHIGAQAAVRLDMDTGQTRIWAGPDTSLVIASIRESLDRAGTRVDIAHGKLLIEAAPQPENSPLRLRSTHSEAEVVGTVLSFDVTPQRDRLQVSHGVVTYGKLSGGERARVVAGGFGEWDGARITLGKFHHLPPAAVTGATVTGFALIDDSTGLPIPGFTRLESGSVIDLGKLQGRKLNIRAEVDWPIPAEESHVVFHYDGQRNTEGYVPYTLFKDLAVRTSSDLPEKLFNGIHVLTATPYAATGKIVGQDKPTTKETSPDPKGIPGHSATIFFTVINAVP
jgi:FecR protein